MGNEFDENGLSISDAPRLLCLDRNSCGEGKINIIDGQEKKSVVDTTVSQDKRENLALTKMAFANAVLNPPSEAFKLFDFSEFSILFGVIKDILLLPDWLYADEQSGFWDICYTGNISGVLLHAQSEEMEYNLDYPNIIGNLFVRTLDLIVSFPEIEKQLNDLF